MPTDKQTDGASPAAIAQATGGNVRLRREGRVVQISLTNADDYSAIELYDRLLASLRQGKLSLDLKLR